MTTPHPGAASAPTLTDRYVYAVQRAIPERQRTGIADELRERIADAIDARLAMGDTLQGAERTVLTELGDPDRLAADYLDQPLHLIGPKYYLTWRRIIRVLLVTVLPMTAAALVIAGAVQGRSVGDIIGSTIGIALTVGVHLCFWTTLAFVIAERWPADRRWPGIPLPPGVPVIGPSGTSGWTLEQLPVIEPGLAAPSLGQAVSTIAFQALVMVFLVGQQFDPFVRDALGHAVPILDPALWSFLIPYLLVILATGIALAIVVAWQRRYAGWSAVAHGVLSVAFAAPVLWLWSQGTLVNPAFNAAVGIDAAGDTVHTIGLVIGIVAVVVVLGDILGEIRGLRSAARRSLPAPRA